MFGTTLLMFMVMLIIWETNVFLATAFLLFFGFIDMVYTSGLPLLKLTTCRPTILFQELPTVFQIAKSTGHAHAVTVALYLWVWVAAVTIAAAVLAHQLFWLTCTDSMPCFVCLLAQHSVPCIVRLTAQHSMPYAV